MKHWLLRKTAPWSQDLQVIAEEQLAQLMLRVVQSRQRPSTESS